MIRLSKMIPNNSVSIHIRRTDYVTSNGYHPVQIEFEKASWFLLFQGGHSSHLDHMPEFHGLFP